MAAALRDDGRISEQHEAYRKGVVLGLTMAEVAILIIFVLLLLLVLSQLRFGGMVPVDVGELNRLRSTQEAVKQLAGELGAQDDSTEEFTHLVRVALEAARGPKARAALAEARSTLAEINRAKEEIQRVAAAGQQNGVDEVTRRVEQQSYDIANKQGQIDKLRGDLEAAGKRVGELPCWARQGGVIDYLYDVILTSAGIRMRERTYADRMRERLALPAPTVDPAHVLSEQEFLTLTKPLYDFSRQRDCRFFVVVYDETAAHEKPLYKQLLAAVEGHFYKRLSDERAPF